MLQHKNYNNELNCPPDVYNLVKMYEELKFSDYQINTIIKLTNSEYIQTKEYQITINSYNDFKSKFDRLRNKLSKNYQRILDHHIAIYNNSFKSNMGHIIEYINKIVNIESDIRKRFEMLNLYLEEHDPMK